MKKFLSLFIILCTVSFPVHAEINLSGRINELSQLIDECKQAGISTVYEEMSLAILERSVPLLPTIHASRLATFESRLEGIYEQAKAKLQGYLEGADSFDSPKYVTSPVKIEGRSMIANTADRFGNEEERPVFFTGYGHFWQPQMDIPLFKNFGINKIQSEISVYDVIVPPGSIIGWDVDKAYGDMNPEDFAATCDIAIGESYDGSNALKITYSMNPTPHVYMNTIQAVSLKPNTVYEYGLSAEGIIGNSRFYIDVFNSDPIDISGRQRWKSFSGEYTTGSESKIVRFAILTEGRTTELLIDDVYVREKGTTNNLIENGDFESVSDGEFGINMSGVRSVISMLEEAEKHDVSVSLLLATHNFPEFIFDKYPELYEPTQPEFLDFNILDQLVERILKEYIRYVVTAVKDYPALKDICLSNEPSYYTYLNPAHLEAWQDYLRELYADIEELNALYSESYSDFSEVMMPNGVSHSARYYDWMIFNNEQVAAWHTMLANTVKEIAPDIPVHSKVTSVLFKEDDSNFKRNFLSRGTDPELFAEFSDLAGNDGSNIYRDGLYDFTVSMQGYDLLGSIQDAPMYNSEDHLFFDYDGDFNANKAIHAGAAMWQGAVHGRTASTIWLWDTSENQDSWIRNTILYRPDMLYRISKANLDLNRLANEVTAIQHEQPQIAILYSPTSRVYNTTYLSAMNVAYQSVLYTGQKAAFVTEKQIAEGALDKYKLLIAPQTGNVWASTLDGVNDFVNNGGRLVMLGDSSFSRNEHNLLLDQAKHQNVTALADEVLSVYNDGAYMRSPSNGDLRDIIFGITEELGMNKAVLREGTSPAINVEWSYTVKDERVIINVCNYDWDNQKTITIDFNGQQVTGVSELIGGTVGESFNLKPFEPMLFSFPLPAPEEGDITFGEFLINGDEPTGQLTERHTACEFEMENNTPYERSVTAAVILRKKSDNTVMRKMHVGKKLDGGAKDYISAIFTIPGQAGDYSVEAVIYDSFGDALETKIIG